MYKFIKNVLSTKIKIEIDPPLSAVNKKYIIIHFILKSIYDRKKIVYTFTAKL